MEKVIQREGLQETKWPCPAVSAVAQFTEITDNMWLMETGKCGAKAKEISVVKRGFVKVYEEFNIKSNIRDLKSRTKF